MHLQMQFGDEGKYYILWFVRAVLDHLCKIPKNVYILGVYYVCMDC